MYSPEEVSAIKKFLANLDLGRDAGSLWCWQVDFSRAKLDGLYWAIAKDDGLTGMHAALMYNPNTPPDVVEYLADKYLGNSKFSADTVVYWLVGNKNTPTGVLLKILQRVPLDVVARYAGSIIAHNNFPPEKVPELVRHSGSGYKNAISYYDLEKALQKPGMTGELIREVWQWGRKIHNAAIVMARCQKTPPDVLEEIARIDYGSRTYSVDIKKALAHNRNTPPGLLAKLAFDRVLEVRLNALTNPSTPEETLRRAYQLSRGSNKWIEIQKALAANPSCPGDVLIALAMSPAREVAEAAAEAMKKREEAA